MLSAQSLDKISLVNDAGEEIIHPEARHQLVDQHRAFKQRQIVLRTEIVDNVIQRQRVDTAS